jgi:hypothetical protein
MTEVQMEAAAFRYVGVVVAVEAAVVAAVVGKVLLFYAVALVS